MVLLVGRLSDRFSPQLLVVSGLILYAVVFIAYAGINELATVAMMITLLSLRFVGEGFIVSPTNLIALRALSENQVVEGGLYQGTEVQLFPF